MTADFIGVIWPMREAVSRSDTLKVAGAFRPRFEAGNGRRGATIASAKAGRMHPFGQTSLRDEFLFRSLRGLKAPATGTESLRDSVRS
jgi:hypothetical protein